MRTPALYPCTVAHVRTGPVRHTLRHHTYLWLVDIDRPPRLPAPLRPFARFDARDHFGGAGPTLRARLTAFLEGQGAVLGPTDRVVMLANARVLGHVFNPLSVFWCLAPDGTPRHVVAEVHNTYGERHCYLLHPDPRGEARVDKEFYVSPFNAVEGGYRMRLVPPGEHLDLTVRLEADSTTPFTATVRGIRRDATPAEVARTVLRRPLAPLAVSAAIRLHGVRLLLKGLRTRPRPRHQVQKGMR
ncbi:DUF1365 family protein [Streptomyces sp. SID5785]|uniref:DUF1365 family protein n=1 Tax=Streptomyces sp. SID5785 TaxID=2690309 RepID=UPI00136131F1|nr:DUF1365 family protein [Streptomyces sp. SID5785]